MEIRWLGTGVPRSWLTLRADQWELVAKVRCWARLPCDGAPPAFKWGWLKEGGGATAEELGSTDAELELLVAEGLLSRHSRLITEIGEPISTVATYWPDYKPGSPLLVCPGCGREV